MTTAALVLAIAPMLSACDRKVAGGRADGPAIFREVCARCHGPKGEPNASMVARYGVKSLRSDRVRNELKDEDIRRQIRQGSKNKQMPSFEGAISDEQIDAVVAHVRSLAAEPPSDGLVPRSGAPADMTAPDKAPDNASDKAPPKEAPPESAPPAEPTADDKAAGKAAGAPGT